MSRLGKSIALNIVVERLLKGLTAAGKQRAEKAGQGVMDFDATDAKPQLHFSQGSREAKGAPVHRADAGHGVYYIEGAPNGRHWLTYHQKAGGVEKRIAVLPSHESAIRVATVHHRATLSGKMEWDDED